MKKVKLIVEIEVEVKDYLFNTDIINLFQHEKRKDYVVIDEAELVRDVVDDSLYMFKLIGINDGENTTVKNNCLTK